MVVNNKNGYIKWNKNGIKKERHSYVQILNVAYMESVYK